MTTSEVWAETINDPYGIKRLGEIKFRDFPDAFIEALRMYNRNANRHITNPQFMYEGKVYVCDEHGSPSKTGKGMTYYWSVHRTNAKKLPVTLNMWMAEGGSVRLTTQYILTIPKSKVSSPNCRQYLE